MNHVDNPFESPAVISFCPGVLGIERGLARAGVHTRVMAYVEIEAFIIANLVAGMEAGVLDPAPIWTDAKAFDAYPFRGKIHGIIGGYPCPGESLAGLREGHLYKGFIWPAIRRAIAAARPLWCFFENVDDHLTGTYPIVQRSLRNMGYAVEAGIFTAEEVGAPHERQRLFILAIADGARLRWINSIRLFTEAKPASKEVAHSIGSGCTKQWHNGEQAKKKNFRTSSAGSKLANAAVTDVQGGFRECDKERYEFKGGSWISWSRSNQWPAGQGVFQFPWEEPRSIKSGLGSTIDGYNFREDLLRAIGNSVVEQTAELAFVTLMNKHFSK